MSYQQPLSRRQHQVWRAMLAYQEAHHGLPPTAAEVERSEALPRDTALGMMRVLVQRGYAEALGSPGMSRRYRALPADNPQQGRPGGASEEGRDEA